MNKFIEERLSNIFKDFKLEIENKYKLCQLKDFNFIKGKAPDYNQKIYQQLYLLRYFAAYFFEYYLAFERILFKDNIFRLPYRVISLGAGSCIDYYALRYLMKGKEMDIKKHLNYTGVDIINWEYKSYSEEFKFINSDIMNLNLNDGLYNLFIFPKSIGEFGNEKLRYLIKSIKNFNFDTKQIGIISSARKSQKSLDKRLFEKVVNAFVEKGFKIQSKKDYNLNRLKPYLFPINRYKNKIVEVDTKSAHDIYNYHCIDSFSSCNAPTVDNYSEYYVETLEDNYADYPEISKADYHYSSKSYDDPHDDYFPEYNEAHHFENSIAASETIEIKEPISSREYNQEKKSYSKKVYFKDYEPFSDFNYPYYIVNYLSNLSKECSNKNCANKSCQQLDRYPMLKMNYLDFQTAYLRRD